MNSKKRYESFLKIVREAEFAWNIEPEDLDVVAAFLRAKAETKRMIRKAKRGAYDIEEFPLPPEEEDHVA